MTPKELRELDAWIAEHVIGFEFPCLFEPTGANGEICCKCNHHISFDRHHFPHPTTDPAAAMQVLEKCANSNAVGVQGNVEIYQEPEGGKWAVCFNAAYQDKCVEPVFGNTLPLAICLFAKKLFAK